MRGAQGIRHLWISDACTHARMHAATPLSTCCCALHALHALVRACMQVIAQVLMGDQLGEEVMARMRRLFDVWLQNIFTPLAIDKWPFPFHQSMNARR